MMSDMTHPTDDELEAMAVKLDCYSHDWQLRHMDVNPLTDTAAMLRACKGRVRVKALEWEYHPAGTIAAPPTGHAYIIDTRMKGRYYSVKGFNPQRQFDSLDEAKAAAQADYEARILSALDPAPDRAEWNAAIEAAAKEIDCGCDGSCMSPHVCPKEDVESIRALKKGQTND